ncbi:MAG TPA: glutaredoxin [Kofleriaceae bacterium]|nr:glutaredoxin [Kofleriaceae bacterium]
MASTTPSKLLGELRAKAVAAFNRADELGGDLRDYLQDRWHHDPRVLRLREQVSRITGKGAPPKVRPAAGQPGGPAPARASDAATAAVPPAPAGVVAPADPPAKPAAPVGLGKPSVAAQVFGKKSCPWTGRAMTVLERNKVDYDFIDLEEPEHEKLALPLSNETKQHTVPYIYLRGQFIGGYNALAEVERLGQLEYALLSAEDKAKAPPHVKRVEITPRPNTDEVAPAERDASAPAE